MHYYGKFIPSIAKGLAAGELEHFRNAEAPARSLKGRARDKVSRFFPACGVEKGTLPKLREYNEADSSAAMLIWRGKEAPDEDRAPDEVWHLTDRFGLIRTTWSAIVEPIEADDILEPTLADHAPGEASVTDWGEIDQPDSLWRPPTPEEIADRKVYLLGDKRPLYEERKSKGIRSECPDCGVVPNVFTLACRC